MAQHAINFDASHEPEAPLTPVVLASVVDINQYRERRDVYDKAYTAKKAFLARYRVPHTRATYGIAIDQWVEWAREHGVDPLEPQRAHIEFFARELEATGRSASTVAGKLNVLGVWFKILVIDGVIEKDPMLAVKRPHVERISKSTLFTRGEVVDMIAAAERSGVQDHALITLLAHHGLRIGETLAINVEDIADHRGQMAVTVLRKGGKEQLITLVPEVAWTMKRLLGDRGRIGPVFLSRTGARLDRKGAGLVVKRIARDAKVEKRAHPHAFRKSMATISRNAGVPDREIIAACGWANAAMLEFYDGGKDTLQANAAMQLAAFLDRAA